MGGVALGGTTVVLLVSKITEPTGLVSSTVRIQPHSVRHLRLTLLRTSITKQFHFAQYLPNKKTTLVEIKKN